ncbi:MAG: efeU [Bacillales bacterium]|nr:efeU [Bacillales bacterium]
MIINHIKVFNVKFGLHRRGKMSKRFGIVFGIFIMCILLASPVLAEQRTWNDVVNDIEKELNLGLDYYKKGDTAPAKEQINEAYFGPYEGGQMEKAVRLNVSAKANAEVEGKFRDIKKSITNKEDYSVIEKKTTDLLETLRDLAAEMDGNTTDSFGMFLSSLLIILREGFEAILILGAIIAYLVKSGNSDKVKVIYQGAFFAVVASAVTAYALKSVFKVSGASQEILEGVTMLIAVAVLFSMSFWLISKVEAKKWQNYIEGKVKQSIGKGSTAALWATVFLAVYREGAETVLFYMAMFSGADESNTNMILMGLLVGSIALVIMFVVIRYGAIKIPIKPFFIGTSILMYYLAFVFAGQGINELQAGNAISVTTINTPTIGFLGIFPTLETVSAQAMLVLITIACIIYYKFISKKKTI